MLNKRKHRKGMELLKPRPALIYCCILWIWFKPLISFCLGKKPLQMSDVRDDIRVHQWKTTVSDRRDNDLRWTDCNQYIRLYSSPTQSYWPVWNNDLLWFLLQHCCWIVHTMLAILDLRRSHSDSLKCRQTYPLLDWDNSFEYPLSSIQGQTRCSYFSFKFPQVSTKLWLPFALISFLYQSVF